MGKKNIVVRHACTDSLGTLPEVMAQLDLREPIVIDITLDKLPEIDNVNMVFLLGCFEAAYDDSLPWLQAEMDWVKEVIAAKIPVVGICFGGQLLARVLGGHVYQNHTLEHAWAEMTLLEEHWQHRGPWFAFHYDAFDPPQEATLLAKTDLANQAFCLENVLGIQFHPEINQHMFQTWIDYWKKSASGLAFLEQNKQLIDDLSKEIDSRAASNQQHFTRLLKDFLDSAH